MNAPRRCIKLAPVPTVHRGSDYVPAMIPIIFIVAALGAPETLNDTDPVVRQHLLEQLEAEALQVARDGGDGSAWLDLRLIESGLNDLSFTADVTVPGLPKHLSFADCTSVSSVECYETESWDTDTTVIEIETHESCSGGTTITCSAPIPTRLKEPVKVQIRCGRNLDSRTIEPGEPLSISGSACLRVAAERMEIGLRPEPLPSVMRLSAPSDAETARAQAKADMLSLTASFASVLAPESSPQPPWRGSDHADELESSRAHDTRTSGVGGIRFVHQADTRPPGPEVVSSLVEHDIPSLPNSMDIAVAGDLLAGAVKDTFMVFDLNTGDKRASLTVPSHREGRRIKDVCVSPDGRFAATVSGGQGTDNAGGGYDIWSLSQAPALIRAVSLARTGHRCLFTGDSRYLAVEGRNGVEIWDLDRDVLRRTYGHDFGNGASFGSLNHVRLLAASPEGASLLLQSDHAFWTVDVDKTDATTRHMEWTGFPLSASWPTPHQVYLAHKTEAHPGSETQAIDWPPGPSPNVRPLPGDRRFVLPFGDQIVIGSQHGALLIDPADGTTMGAVFSDSRRPHDIAASLDGKWIVQTMSNGPTRVARNEGQR